MPHREIRPDERCGRSTLPGVHVYGFTKEQQSGADGKKQMVEMIRCIHCSLEPLPEHRARLWTEREQQVERDALAKRLHDSQKQGTGTQISGRRTA